ncbi:DUF1127 domain-containing protein [Neoroseomonas soli]|uniref:DUF1127 domain-containing protein n=1 Tax=Neoroseomonas soli TaxID=1081025 RepID=A0A9X9X255_9PROT|nr:DUF1127 domain-containing protein [Neoroseomonas soli]MBR0673484.1 DUF1127 domain-containing protein [Neoroseomonas soli]
MSVECSATSLRTAGHPAAHGTTAAPGLWARFRSRATDAMERRRARRLIVEMEDRMLRDIGLARGDVERAIRYGREDARPVLPWWRM